LNAFAATGRKTVSAVRSAIIDLLSENTSNPAVLRDNKNLRQSAFHAQKDVTMHLPMFIRDYTDFYAGRDHAFRVGTMYRGPQNALQPNYYHIPVGYHGRASSVVVSGVDIKRYCQVHIWLTNIDQMVRLQI
jgi:fumarylacetoacetase